MAFSPKKMQRGTHKVISMTPDGYRPRHKIIAKIKEEKEEVYEAADEYKASPRPKTLGHLKREFGDLLYAVCCLANSYGKVGIGKKERWKIPLDEAFAKTPKEHQDRESRKANLDRSVDMLEKALIKDPEDIQVITERIGELLFAIVDFVPVCCEKDMENIDLDHGFTLILNNNKKRNKE